MDPIRVDDRELKSVLAELKRAGVNIATALKPVMGDATKDTKREAVNKAPLAEGPLRRSAQARVEMVGDAEVRGHVTFGGVASAYAEVQHEAEDFRHTLPSGVSRSTRKDGKPRKHPIKGYRGGQAHFLHGAADSAWTRQSEADLTAAAIRKAYAELEKAAGGG